MFLFRDYFFRCVQFTFLSQSLICHCRKDTEVLCIIFVERIITAKLIARVMKKITDFSHFNVSYLTGSNSSVDGISAEAHREVLESSCGGKVCNNLTY